VDRQQKVPPLPNLLPAASAPAPRTPGGSDSRLGGAALLYACFIFLSRPYLHCDVFPQINCRNEKRRPFSLIPISDIGRKMPYLVVRWLDIDIQWRSIAHTRKPIGYTNSSQSPHSAPQAARPVGQASGFVVFILPTDRRAHELLPP
jgi:hypothetical protein